MFITSDALPPWLMISWPKWWRKLWGWRYPTSALTHKDRSICATLLVDRRLCGSQPAILVNRASRCSTRIGWRLRFSSHLRSCSFVSGVQKISRYGCEVRDFSVRTTSHIAIEVEILQIERDD